MKTGLVARTILEQLGGNRFLAMTGAKNLVSYDAGNGEEEQRGALCMKVTATRNGKRPAPVYVKITLTHDDFYDVRVIDQHATRLETTSGIGRDQLRRVFEERTGLRTSL